MNKLDYDEPLTHGSTSLAGARLFYLYIFAVLFSYASLRQVFSFFFTRLLFALNYFLEHKEQLLFIFNTNCRTCERSEPLLRCTDC